MGALVLPLAAHAQIGQPGATAAQKRDAWQKLSPQEKEARKEAFREKLRNLKSKDGAGLEPARKEEWMQRYQNATPEEQAKIKERLAARRGQWQAEHPGNGLTPMGQPLTKEVPLK